MFGISSIFFLQQQFYPSSFNQINNVIPDSSIFTDEEYCHKIMKFPEICFRNHLLELYKTKKSADFRIDCSDGKSVICHKYLLFSYIFKKENRIKGFNEDSIPIEQRYNQEICNLIFTQSLKNEEKEEVEGEEEEEEEDEEKKENKKLKISLIHKLKVLVINVNSEIIELFLSFLYHGRIRKTLESMIPDLKSISIYNDEYEEGGGEEELEEELSQNIMNTSIHGEHRRKIYGLFNTQINLREYQKKQIRMNQYDNLFDFSVRYLSPKNGINNHEISNICFKKLMESDRCLKFLEKVFFMNLSEFRQKQQKIYEERIILEIEKNEEQQKQEEYLGIKSFFEKGDIIRKKKKKNKNKNSGGFSDLYNQEYFFKLHKDQLKKYRKSFYQYDQKTFISFTERTLLAKRKNIKVVLLQQNKNRNITGQFKINKNHDLFEEEEEQQQQQPIEEEKNKSLEKEEEIKKIEEEKEMIITKEEEEEEEEEEENDFVWETDDWKKINSPQKQQLNINNEIKKEIVDEFVDQEYQQQQGFIGEASFSWKNTFDGKGEEQKNRKSRKNTKGIRRRRRM